VRGGAQIRIEEALDAFVDGTEGVTEKLVFAMETAEERAGDLERAGVGRGLADRLAEGGEFQVDVAEEFAIFREGRRGLGRAGLEWGRRTVSPQGGCQRYRARCAGKIRVTECAGFLSLHGAKHGMREQIAASPV
jgi:hypothetical protein